MNTTGECRICRLGVVEYQSAWELQRRLVEQRAAEECPDTLLLLEHPPTYTLGPRGEEEHILASRGELARRGAVVHRVDRGGDVTFHGPGQLVGYPVLSLNGRSAESGWVHRYLRDLEQALILALASFGVSAGRQPGYTGVWVGDAKIAAIGVKMNSRRITSHGFALNVTTDLTYFDLIIPCGIRNKAVTSLSRVLGRAVPMDEVVDEIGLAFGNVFGMRMQTSEEPL